MRAIAYQTPQAINAETALVDIELPTPEPKGRDLLVEIKAVSVNPVDTKLRRNAAPADGGWRVLGFDAAGIVKAVGPDVTLFKAGDAVFYAGAIDRPEEPKGPAAIRPVHGSAVPKAGKRFGGSGGAAPQGV